MQWEIKSRTFTSIIITIGQAGNNRWKRKDCEIMWDASFLCLLISHIIASQLCYDASSLRLQVKACSRSTSYVQARYRHGPADCTWQSIPPAQTVLSLGNEFSLSQLGLLVLGHPAFTWLNDEPIFGILPALFQMLPKLNAEATFISITRENRCAK